MFFLWLSVEKSLEHRGDLRTACICLRCQQRPAAGCSAGDEADCHCPFNRFSRPACDLRLIGEGTQVCSCGNVLAVVLGEVEKDQGDLLSGDIVVGAELAVAVAGNDTVFIRPQDGVGVVSHTVPLFQLHFELWAGCHTLNFGQVVSFFVLCLCSSPAICGKRFTYRQKLPAALPCCVGNVTFVTVLTYFFYRNEIADSAAL